MTKPNMPTNPCTLCGRGERHHDGCSVVACPMRRRITAQEVGERYASSPVYKQDYSNAPGANGGVRRMPTINTEDD